MSTPCQCFDVQPADCKEEVLILTWANQDNATAHSQHRKHRHAIMRIFKSVLHSEVFERRVFKSGSTEKIFKSGLQKRVAKAG